ncbi:VWA domain-containing protein [Ancylomarina sp. 16SWW S1-10-2]|uniref:vWA domain-containing protein n=1 Tax=Ancylomarina sp. 16SWW S1-10-2 TaxID=2499681 RepID=UPI0012ADA4BD|nr:VWA domain-containing protein [Ancylomarina sp. 16SWW S1-10-2]MRT91443.1 VWA domain-containing protein [Ancylomarina sp. 16SWW S1-10-2]
MKKLITYCFFILLCLFAVQAFSQKIKTVKDKTRILFIFDASQSMNGKWENSIKMNIARDFLIEMIDSLEFESNVEMALRVYGHQSSFPPQDCEDTKLEVPFSEDNAGEIRQTLRYLKARGTTPIAYALSQAATDFPKSKEETRNLVILITDGVEACDGDPCAVSDELQKNGIILQPFIIGIGLDRRFHESFECVGEFLEVDKEEDFGGTLNYVISQVLDKTSMQVNLLDENDKPTESDVTMTFYNHKTGKLRYQYMHTLNYIGIPDTLFIDPLISYDITIHTIPNLHADSIRIEPGKHSVVSFKAVQGRLKIISQRSNLLDNLSCVVKKNENTINVQSINNSQKYLIGTYSLELLTLPRIKIDKVKIKASETTLIKVPLPGLVTISKPTYGPCDLFIKIDGQMEWVCAIDSNVLRQTLTLQPGNYHVVFRSKAVHLSHYTKKRAFKVIPGSSILVRL